MTSDAPSDDSPAGEQMADLHEKKDDAVLERESVEQELMQDDESDAGEDIDGVQDKE